jgi:cytosine/adenosine deaminase-related metal-dependent hydrolase
MSAVGDMVWGPDGRGLAITVAGDRIAGLEISEAGGGEAAGTLIAPGDVNCHTHIYSGLAPLGMPAPAERPENFLQILERVWWRLDRALDEETLRAAARFYVGEALLAGTTALVDHHESPGFIEGSLDVLADACQELGMRAVLTYGATERNGEREEARRGLAECRRFITTNRRPLVKGVVGLHASFTVSDGTIREAAELCRELDTVMHVHMAEDGADVLDAQARGYPGPLERLLDLGALPAGSIMAHGVHLAADQVRRAADAGIWLVQNPRSNRGNEVGYPPALALSSRVGLGTDGYPAAMAEEAAVLREEAGRRGEPEADVEARIAAGHDLLEELFGLAFAPLAAGGAADAVWRRGGEVRRVMVAGREVMRDGRLAGGDVEAIRAEAERQAPRLWSRMTALA